MRKMSNAEIASVAVGTVSISEDENRLLHFYKYTKTQMDGFGAWNSKSPVLCTTGVRLDFHTDSSKINFAAASPGKYEIYIDGIFRAFYRVVPAEPDCDEKYRVGENISFRICDPLGHKKEEHRVTLYFPSHSIGLLSYVELDDGAYARRHKFSSRFLMIGDSITQGWNSAYDSFSYANRVSRFFDADSIIQGRGGSYYKEETIEKLPGFEPDVLTIAYGTNDFAHYKTLEDMKQHLCAYLDKVKEAYGDKERCVFVISPIWRKDRYGKPMGDFESCCALIGSEAVRRGFVHIDGMSLVPPVEELFTDGLHLNDLGFSLYSENLIKEMRKYI